jgi:hypothetical protein
MGSLRWSETTMKIRWRERNGGSEIGEGGGKEDGVIGAVLHPQKGSCQWCHLAGEEWQI